MKQIGPNVKRLIIHKMALMSEHSQEGGRERCTKCCWKDRCDAPEHFHRDHCPYCRGTGTPVYPSIRIE